MCGFVALISSLPEATQLELVERMTAVIRHRGPDDNGMEFRDGVTLGFRRLSILDLSLAGHQPMFSPDGRVAIVFNGEIYNFVELRRELEAVGHVFRSNGDTEVLLHAYLEWGTACLDRLNGMWAFVIHDRRDGSIFGSRDRFGIKPLYVFQTAGSTVLASEIKCIRASGLYVAKLNLRTAACFLVDGTLEETAETMHQGIEQIRPGHAFLLDAQHRFRQWRYWDLNDIREEPEQDPASQFAELFEDAVRVHMRSDVPVGVHLSGGLDSTSIICASARVRRSEVATSPLYAFSFRSNEFDEAPYIDATLRHAGATGVELHTGPRQLWADLPRVLQMQDEPVHSLTAVVGYQLMRLAADHGIKVILNGQGADETIGGYSSYFRDAWFSHLQAGRLGRVWREISDYAATWDQARLRLFADLIRHYLQAHLSSLQIYPVLKARRRRLALAGQKWVSHDLLKWLPLEPRSVPPPDLRGTLIRSVERNPLPIYLRVEDRNSMAHSIEVRLPFLDVRLVRALFQLPTSWKLNGPWNKYVLRQAMQGRIPETVRARVDKMGFPTPASRWFGQELFTELRDTFASLSDKDPGLLNKTALLESLEEHRSGMADHTNRLFAAAQFIIWCRQVGVG